MSYPNDIDTFTDKLNKREKAYVIEEEVALVNGVYESLLDHDNIVDSSVSVWTGSKLTGDKVANFILSIPSATPWKRSIKIFSSVSPVFITYETFGDQVEADDINQLQSSMTATQKEVDRYKAANDFVVDNTVNRVTTLENKKSDKTYVDTELLKKADKETTYTKTETDARIQAVVDAAPEALDTLIELAAALNNDPDFAGTMTLELSKKVDKVAGKQLSTNDYSTAEKSKLAGVEAGANKYIHPATHPATIIVEDSTHRFTTDAEKTNWNGKLDDTANAVSASKLATGRTIALSGDVTGSVVFDGSSNVMITATVVDDSHNHVISNVDGLQEALDSKETTDGAQTKADKALTDAKAWGVNAISSGSTADPNTTKEPYILTNHANNPSGGGIYWHIQTLFYSTKTGNRGQIAVTYNGTTPKFAFRHLYGSTWTTWQETLTPEDLGNAGYGDMLKSIYDTNGNGVVDAAESVPWSGIAEKPSAFPPSAHIHNSIPVIDVRSISSNDSNYDPPPSYLTKEIQAFFSSAFPGGTGWRSALTLKGWQGDSYAAWQLLGPASTITDDNFYLRSGIGSDWRPPVKIWHDGNDGTGSGLDADLLDGKHASDFMKKGPLTWNDLKGV